MKTILFITITSLILLTSCMYSSYPNYKTKNYRNTDPEEIEIYSKGIVQDYVIIGQVGADIKGDSIAVVERVKKKASKLGADAIIHFNLNHIYVSEEICGSGVAIKLVQIEDENVPYANVSSISKNQN